MQPPTPDITPIAARAFERMTVSAKHPPGLYGAKCVASALNELGADAVLSPLRVSGMQSYGEARTIALQPYLLALGALLLFLDALVSLWLRGYLPQRMLSSLGSVLPVAERTVAVRPAVSRFTPRASMGREMRVSAHANRAAVATDIRPEGSGRRAVRRISLSDSRSQMQLNALAAPTVPAVPSIAKTHVCQLGCERARAMPPAAVKST